MKFEITITACALALATLAVGCSGDDYGDYDGFNGNDDGWSDDGGDGNDGGSSGLDPSAGQGGAQDFGLFRQILLAGGIPGPETIDDLGFFAEHKIAMPAAECGQNVCIHGMLGVMGNMISGSNCTLVMIGMNTPIDPDTLERPPLNLAIAVDLSGSMSGEPIQRLRTGLLTMIDELEPDDRISLVGFADEAELLVSQLAARRSAVSYEPDSSNPYAAPVAGAEAGGRRNFAFTDEVRKLISTTAILMIVGGLLMIVPSVVRMILNDFSVDSLIVAALYGVIPVFTVIAGFSLRGLARPGDDLGALLSGFRQLYVAYLIKGVVMLLIVGLTLLNLLFAVIGVGVGFAKLWG